jgi:hypothetical protein
MIVLYIFLGVIAGLWLLAFILDPEGHAIKENKALAEWEKQRNKTLNK